MTGAGVPPALGALAPDARRHRLGLVVGKFSPLHKGHEFLISQALARCDELVVLGYSQPELPGCGRLRRQAWLARRFPQVQAHVLDDDEVRRLCARRGVAWQPMPDNTQPDAVQQAYLAWLLQGPVGLRPDAMFGSEAYVAPCAARLSQALGQPVAAVCVDQARVHVPISATRIRQDVHAHRAWLSPEVYGDFVQRVLVLGGESTGKTTLAQALARHHGSAWVPEFGRTWWEARHGVLGLDDLLHIGRTQVAHEEALLGQAHRYLFCDTSPLTTLGYAGWMFDAQPPELVALAARRYDLVVLCEGDFGFVQDGTRQDEAFRTRQQHWYEAVLASPGAPGPVLRVRGSVAQRLAAVNARLGATPA